MSLLLIIPSAWLALTVAAAFVVGPIAGGARRHSENAPGNRGTQRHEAKDSLQEQRHEVIAALLGIEAAAHGLSRNRAALTEPQLDELSDGLVAEIHRLRSLIDLRSRETVTVFDLREAIGPVLACTRAADVELIDSVPHGIEVVGVPSKTVEVCATLLRNAQDHAHGSPIEVRTELGDGVARLCVEDRGQGFAPAIIDAAFERSVRGPSSTGSGLGLHIARRLMDEQGGSIRAEARPGGGASVVLELPLARTRALVTA